jgi:hypothetical protein
MGVQEIGPNGFLDLRYAEQHAWSEQSLNARERRKIPARERYEREAVGPLPSHGALSEAGDRGHQRHFGAAADEALV